MGSEHDHVVQYGDAQAEPRLDVLLMDVSYFSGKLESYLRFKRIPFRRVETTHREMVERILPNTGLMEVPAVFDHAEGRWLRDTTAIIELAEAEQWAPARPVLPANPVDLFLSLLIEDFADEWLWTPALFYRWAFRLDAGNLVRRFRMHDFLREPAVPMPGWAAELATIDRQYDEYVRKAGVQDEAGAAFVQQVYRTTLATLQAHLSQHKFLAGSRPSLADFGLMASMFRHFSLDPTPSKIMRLEAPAVFEWVARMWNAAELPDGPSDGPGLQAPTLNPLLRAIGVEYLPYLVANARAVVRGGDAPFSSGALRPKPVPFRAWSALRLVRHWHDRMSPRDREQVRARFAALGVQLDDMFDQRELFETAAARWEGAKPEPPLCLPRGELASRVRPRVAAVTGTPSHTTGTLRDLGTPLARRALLLLVLLALLAARGGREARKAMLWAALGATAMRTLQDKYM